MSQLEILCASHLILHWPVIPRICYSSLWLSFNLAPVNIQYRAAVFVCHKLANWATYSHSSSCSMLFVSRNEILLLSCKACYVPSMPWCSWCKQQLFCNSTVVGQNTWHDCWSQIYFRERTSPWTSPVSLNKDQIKHKLGCYLLWWIKAVFKKIIVVTKSLTNNPTKRKIFNWSEIKISY